MTIFFQQSGKRGEIDFQKTLAKPNGDVQLLSTEQMTEHYGFSAKPTSLGPLTNNMRFQVWGVPSGARRIMELMRPGDLALLIGQLSPKALEYGRFYYAGRVVHVQTEEDHQLSRRLWGDGGFPLVFFTQGALVDYAWTQFQDDFGFSKGYYEAGNIKRVLESRVLASRYKTEDSFANSLGIPYYGSDLSHVKGQSGFAYELVPPDDGIGFAETSDGYELSTVHADSEGERALKVHCTIERSSALVTRFKSSLKNLTCAICNFDFEKTYGQMGRGYIEAHHVRPLSEGTRLTTLTDFLPVCANCHRILHRNWPNNDVPSLRACFAALAKSPL